ncbi:ATP-binding protein [Allorhizobium sp. BGMRC 0089]|uniref:ATP-binding protein n=1 Tax=Allorhizobium sonneratiae TaxID=2934936 RepID=UPI002033FFEE|nr:ATP-binding protein [Allorhizobium sonneratiae]MCM2291347.1 ATP-binding protein [Allorhizobium sonneratiae]
MVATHYPFIDIAVHGAVRDRFARGEAMVLFSADLKQTLWANGKGAAFFGKETVFDLLEQGAPAQDVTFRQIAAMAGQLQETGASRDLMLRIGSGFRLVPVTARLQRLEIRAGEPVILFSLPSPGFNSLTDRAESLISGFDDPDTHMALIDGDGGVIRASSHFDRLGMTAETMQALARQTGHEAGRLMKRPIPTACGRLPAAMACLSDTPQLYLLFAVETLLGGMDETETATAMPAPQAARHVPDHVPDQDAAIAQTLLASEENNQPVSEPDPLVPASPTGEDAVDAYADVVEALGGITEVETELQDFSPPVTLAPWLEDESAATQSEKADDEAGDRVEAPADADTETEESAAFDSATAEDRSHDPLQLTALTGPMAQDDRPATEETSAEPGITHEESGAEAEDQASSDVDLAKVEQERQAAAAPASAEINRTERSDAAPEKGAQATQVQATQVQATTVQATGAEATGAFVFAPKLRAMRFVWKIDALGRFTEISPEFAQAVGPHAAAIKGQAFSDVAALFDLDPEGRIGELLKKRDTWSGKTILWPVEGTTLRVPVDIAALPTYTRQREFDGFRGFGVVRLADVIEDPDRVGLTLAPETGRETGTEIETKAPVAEPPVFGDSETDAASIPALTMPAASPLPEEEEPKQQEQEQQEPVQDEAAQGEAMPEAAPAAPDDAEQTPVLSMTSSQKDEQGRSGSEKPVTDEAGTGEPAPLALTETPSRRLSDRVVQMEDRRIRGREGLSPVEQAAFKEIARRLDALGVKIKPSSLDEAANGNDEIDNPGPATDEPQQDTMVADDAVANAAEASALPIAANDSAAIKTAPEASGPSAQQPETEPTDNSAPPSRDAVIRASVPGAMPISRRDVTFTPDVLDMLPVALLAHRGDRLIHANPEFLSLTGYRSLADLEQAGGLDALMQRMEIAEDGKNRNSLMIVRQTDETIPVSAHLQSIRWEEASALLLALVPERQESATLPEEQPPAAAPATAQAETETRNLAAEVAELRSILETATDGVVTLGAEGDIRTMNGAASGLFNYDEADLVGRPFVTLFAHESQRLVMEYLASLSGHGVASVLNDGREVMGRESSGGYLPLFMTIGRLPSSNGFCAVIRDIAQWKRTEEELRNAKRAAETANQHKSDFLARVSHEIRTPLNAIIGFADIMANERFGPIGHSRYSEYAADIGRSGRHVLDIVNDLLDISKIEAGQMQLDFTTVNLNETVAEGVALVQPQANAERVIIRTALSQNLPDVVADLRSIRQIVLNILSNAIRFTPPGGQIIVSTGLEANGSVILRVRDTGIGMSRAELEQAMKPFRQVATNGVRLRGDGTGLGLPLTKAMVDANKAQFSIQSAPNEGTLVEIAFPSQRVLAE